MRSAQARPFIVRLALSPSRELAGTSLRPCATKDIIVHPLLFRSFALEGASEKFTGAQGKKGRKEGYKRLEGGRRRE